MSPLANPDVQVGLVLASNVYDPVGLATYTTTSSAIADVDSANMAVTFNAPATGIVIVRLEAVLRINSPAALCSQQWGLREAAATVGALQRVLAASSGTYQVRCGATFKISGISAGSHTYKWAFARDTGAVTTEIFVGGVGVPGPAIMTVFSA